MNVNYLKAFGCVLFLALISIMATIMFKHIVSLIFMADEITFSASVFMSFLGTPILFYSMSASIFFFVVGRLPKHNKFVIKYLAILMFSSFILGPPISLYVDYMLKNDGYLVCDRISWMSPTTYVTDLSLC